MNQRRVRSIWGIILGATAVTLIILIASGAFDPQPVGQMQWQRPLPRQTIPAHGEQIIWLTETIPTNDFTIRLTAVHQSGELDSGYGLALGHDTQAFIISLSPTGYVTIQQTGNGAPSILLTPQRWPHVRLGNQVNEIWLDVVDGVATIRLNRELLWQGEVGQLNGRFGLYGASWGETAVVDFQQLYLFQ